MRSAHDLALIASGNLFSSQSDPTIHSLTMNALPQTNLATPADDPLIIAGRSYTSRLLTGTGKFRDLDETRRATEAAGAQIVTVAIRRTNIGQNPGEPSLLEVLPPSRYTILPTPRAATRPRMRCARAVSRASCSMATRW